MKRTSTHKHERRQRKSSKRAQVTIFMFLGIVFILLTLLFLVLSSGTSLQLFLKQTKHPVEFYMEECMRFLLADAVENLTKQGGFIYFRSRNLTTDQRVIAYSVYNNQNTTPSLDFMQRQIGRYIEDNIESCFEDATFNLVRQGDPRARVIIYPEKVYAELRFPINAQIGEMTYIYNEFATENMIPLGRMIELRDEVIKDLIEYPNLMLLDKLYATDFEMIINPYSNNIKIIEMINRSHRIRNDPLTFTMAIYERHSLADPLHFHSKIPDVVVYVDEPVRLQARCNKPCEFSDNTILFDIDENSGVIDFIPDLLDIGDYNITITITDDIYAVTDSFRMVVLPGGYYHES